jgi:hypothetical protein
MEYKSVKETAARWGISDRRIHALCKEGRIEGVFRIGNAWAIPADAEKPVDARLRSERIKRGKSKPD